MTCDDVRPRLSAYLDGDLDPDRGTVVRGHLRTCEACRNISEQEAVLRDGLRSLPPLDPPSNMWGDIQARLAAAEVEESKRPAWKRALARWTPMWPRFAVGGMLAAAAASILWWRAQSTDDPKQEVQNRVVDVRSPEISPSTDVLKPKCNLDGPADGDVTEDLLAEQDRVTKCYEEAANELLALANQDRAKWTDEQRSEFDARISELRAGVDSADKGRAQQRAWRAMNRYLQTTLTRDNSMVFAAVVP